MKRLWMLLALLCALCLTACGASDTPPAGTEPPPSGSAAAEPEESPENAPEDAPEVHTLSEGGNVIEHEPQGYCGNTVTSVSKEKWAGGDTWTVSFWGDDSVALTDLLRFLDYSGEICRCLPEYTVDTEFGEDYGVNLTEGYARCGDGQTDLTAEQLELIQGIIERQSENSTPDAAQQEQQD